MSRKKISDLQVVQAVARSKDWGGQFADGYLRDLTGEHPKVCMAAMERAERRGLIEYGVSLRSGWLTDKGRALLEAGDE